MTSHMARKDAVAPNNDCPRMGIHIIDIPQPPGIGIASIADMDVHHAIVTTELAIKSNATIPKNVRRAFLSEIIFPVNTRYAGATNNPSRYVPGAHGQAIGTCSKGHPIHANRQNRCDKSRRPPVQKCSCRVARG